MIKFLQRSFRRLRQRADWKRKVTGGAFVIEVTSSESGWHAHLHIVLVGKYFPFKILLKNWKSITGATGVFIKRIPPSKATGYLTKYISKPGKGIDHDNSGFVSGTLYGVRLFQPFGEWYAISAKYSPKPIPCKSCKKSEGYIVDFEFRRFFKHSVNMEHIVFKVRPFDIK